MKNIKRFVPLLVVFLLGIIVNQGISIAIAHGGNVNFIHSCVANKDGSIRIVGPNDLCKGKETAVDWNQNGIGAFGGFKTDQLIGITLVNDSLDYRSFDGANLSKAYIVNTSIKHASFVGVNFTDAIIYDSQGIEDSDFTNANFTNADLSRSLLSLPDSKITGAIWSNTTCPDGTNSDNNGNTCEGHLPE